jgi:hypothetical protein
MRLRLRNTDTGTFQVVGIAYIDITGQRRLLLTPNHYVPTRLPLLERLKKLLLLINGWGDRTVVPITVVKGKQLALHVFHSSKDSNLSKVLFLCTVLYTV